MFIAAGARLTTPAVNVMMESTRKTVLNAFCPYKAGQVLSLIQSDRQTQGLNSAQKNPQEHRKNPVSPTVTLTWHASKYS